MPIGWYRRYLSCLFTLLFLIPLLPAAPADTGALTVISSACEVDYPPFCIVDDAGRAGGFSVELLQEAMRAMGRRVTFRTGPWSDVKGWLEKGMVEALPLVGRTPEREDVFDFTFPYLTLRGAIVTRDTNDAIRTLDDLRGRQVAVMAGDNAEEFLRRGDYGCILHTARTFGDALSDLARGQYDAVVVQQLLAQRIISDRGLSNLRIAPHPLDSLRQDFCFAVHEGDRRTLAVLNEGLALVFADGTFARLRKKWFGTQHLPVSGRVVIGTEAGYPPFSFNGPGRDVSGFNPDLIRAVAAAVGMDVSIEYRPWAELRRALLDGHIDAIAGMYYSPSRDSLFDFTAGVATIHHAVFTGAGSPGIRTEADLQGQRIIVMENDIMHDYVLKHRLTDTLKTVATLQDAVRLLQSGAPGYTLLAKLPGLYWKKELKADRVRVTGPVLNPAQYCFAVHEGNTALLQRLEEGLAIINETGQYNALYRTWLGALEPEYKLFKALGVAALVVTALLLIAVVWTILLRAQVRVRTQALQDEVVQHRRTADRLKQLEVAVENAVDGIALASLDGVLLYLNTSFARMHGYTRNEIIGQHLSILHTPDQMRDQVGPFNEQVKRTGEHRGEVWHITKNGSPFPTLMATSMVRDAAGAPAGLVGVAHDITERKEAEERLRRVNTRLSATLEALPDLFMELDGKGIIQQARVPAGFASGLPAKCAGRHVRDVFPGDAAAAVLDAVRDAGAGRTGRSVGASYSLDQPDGRHWFELSVAAVQGGAAPSRRYIALARDITGRVRSEEELQKTQRLESLGLLAGGIAHDFNNLLAAVFGNIELARFRLHEPAGADEYLGKAMQSIEHTRELTRQLLTFAKGGAPVQESIQLLPLVEESRNLALGGSGTECMVRVPDDLPDIYADRGQILQVLNNILLNARQVMHETGSVIITAAVEDVGAGAVPGLESGTYAVLHVHDNGPGMPEHVRSQVLEPFFSTRPDGTGLGLAICHSIIKKHGGALSVDSAVKSGTTVTLYLPVTGRTVRHDEEQAPVQREPAAVPTGAGRWILVMDDDELVCDVLAGMLRKSGYTVVTANSAEETVRMFREAEGSAHPFDLVVLDLMIPGAMKGEHVLDALRKVRADVPAVVTSGYTANPVMMEPVLFGFQDKIDKPFKEMELLRVIAGVLS